MTNRTATIIIIVLAVLLLGGGGVYLLCGRNDLDRENNNGPVGSGQSAVASQETQDTLSFHNLKRTESLENKVLLFGNSLIGVPSEALSKRLEDSMKHPVDVRYDAAMTSTEAISGLLTVFGEHPPRYLVLDIGRYDSEHGISVDMAMANIAMIVTKAAEFDVRTAVIGGIGADGDATFAARVQPVLGSSALFVDATPLLLDTDMRTSPLELNIQGAAALATMIKKALTD